MAAEAKRGRGYRKVGGTYLVGGGIFVTCDRIPYPLESCPVCGGGVHFTRAMTEINPRKLFGLHDDYGPIQDHFTEYPGLKAIMETAGGFFKKCKDQLRPCYLCDPEDKPAYIMMVGEKFYPTPAHFMEEAKNQGISKRIPFIPKNLILGETVIYLAHNKACVITESAKTMQNGLPGFNEEDPKLITTDKQVYKLGIFSAFVPRAIEKIFWQSEIDKMSPEDMEDLKKRGISPVGIPDGDPDHA